MTWAHDQQHIDRLRGHRIRTTLRRLPSILEDLQPTPKRGAGIPSIETLLPISETVIQAKDELRNTLAGWARITIEEQHVPAPTDTTLTGLAAHLAQHSEWLGRHPAGEQAEEEIAASIASLEHLTDRPSTTTFAGHCPACGVPVYAPEGRQRTQCRTVTDRSTGETCNEVIDVEAGRAELFDRAASMHASAADIARILPVKAATVRQWGRRGKLGGYCDVLTRETRWHIGTVIDELARRWARERVAA